MTTNTPVTLNETIAKMPLDMAIIAILDKQSTKAGEHAPNQTHAQILYALRNHLLTLRYMDRELSLEVFGHPLLKLITMPPVCSNDFKLQLASIVATLLYNVFQSSTVKARYDDIYNALKGIPLAFASSLQVNASEGAIVSRNSSLSLADYKLPAALVEYLTSKDTSGESLFDLSFSRGRNKDATVLILTIKGMKSDLDAIASFKDELSIERWNREGTRFQTLEIGVCIN